MMDETWEAHGGFDLERDGSGEELTPISRIKIRGGWIALLDLKWVLPL
jgi:hypothetical protein